MSNSTFLLDLSEQFTTDGKPKVKKRRPRLLPELSRPEKYNYFNDHWGAFDIDAYIEERNLETNQYDRKSLRKLSVNLRSKLRMETKLMFDADNYFFNKLADKHANLEKRKILNNSKTTDTKRLMMISMPLLNQWRLQKRLEALLPVNNNNFNQHSLPYEDSHHLVTQPSQFLYNDYFSQQPLSSQYHGGDDLSVQVPEALAQTQTLPSSPLTKTFIPTSEECPSEDKLFDDYMVDLLGSDMMNEVKSDIDIMNEVKREIREEQQLEELLSLNEEAMDETIAAINNRNQTDYLQQLSLFRHQPEPSSFTTINNQFKRRF